MLELAGYGFYSVHYTDLWDKQLYNIFQINGIIRANFLSRHYLFQVLSNTSKIKADILVMI